MKAIVVFDGRFKRKNGRPASHHLNYDSFAKRYLEVFDSVTIIAREYDEEDPEAELIEGPGVTFVGVQGYDGPLGFVRGFAGILRQLFAFDVGQAKVIYRTPGVIPFLMWGIQLVKGNRKYGVEVVADPYDQLSKGTTKSILRPFFQVTLTCLLKLQCRYATVASYVTEYALQRRYPSKSKWLFHYTSLNLTDDWLVDVVRRRDQHRIVSVGMMTKLYKGQDVLIQSVSELNKRGLLVNASLIGDGAFRPALEQLSRDLKIDHLVTFLGTVKHGRDLQRHLDDATMFVLPSRQEGLPRAIIEAMARGLPVVATNVGGIPELLEPECLVPPDRPDLLADKIAFKLCNVEHMHEIGLRNLEVARTYSVCSVQARRNQFYTRVIEHA